MSTQARHTTISVDDVRARVRSWPEQLGARFEPVVAEWLSDTDARLVGQLLTEFIAVAISPLDLAVDVDDRLAAMLAVLLHHLDTREFIMADEPQDHPRGLAGIKSREFSEADWRPGSGEFRRPDPQRVKPAYRFRGPLFDPPDWPLSPGDPT